MPDQNIFGLQVAVNDLLLLQQIQGAEHLLGEAPNHFQGETTEGVGFDELVQVHVQQLGRDAKMFSEVETVGEVHHAVPIFRVLVQELATSPVSIDKSNIPIPEASARCSPRPEPADGIVFCS